MRRVVALCACPRDVWRGRPHTRSPRRLLTVDDLFNLREVRDPQRSPDGKWVAYTVARAIKTPTRTTPTSGW